MNTRKLFNLDLSRVYTIPVQGSWPQANHQFDEASVAALRAAIASGRPLLVRGEPGIGKSQLARAAATVLDVPFLPFVVDERTERDDLLYKFDAVARLAQAQVSALVAQSGVDRDWEMELAEENFFRPGVLWWAFDWNDAAKQEELFFKRRINRIKAHSPPKVAPAEPAVCGPVVLIDEIDKADPSVPNGLLECLGNHGFHTSQLGRTIKLREGQKPPLVIISTNEDRELPPAFLRRCLVLRMEFPADRSTAERFLIDQRARVFWTKDQVSNAVCKVAVELLLQARSDSAREGVPMPGAAEFLDILRVLVGLCEGDMEAQESALQEISRFALKKHAETRR